MSCISYTNWIYPYTLVTKMTSINYVSAVMEAMLSRIQYGRNVVSGKRSNSFVLIHLSTWRWKRSIFAHNKSFFAVRTKHGLPNGSIKQTIPAGIDAAVTRTCMHTILKKRYIFFQNIDTASSFFSTKCDVANLSDKLKRLPAFLYA